MALTKPIPKLGTMIGITMKVIPGTTVFLKTILDGLRVTLKSKRTGETALMILTVGPKKNPFNT